MKMRTRKRRMFQRLYLWTPPAGTIWAKHFLSRRGMDRQSEDIGPSSQYRQGTKTPLKYAR